MDLDFEHWKKNVVIKHLYTLEKRNIISSFKNSFWVAYMAYY